MVTVCPAMDKFFVLPAVEQQSRVVRACMRNGTLSMAFSQFLFELGVYEAAVTHPRRTFRLEDATAVLLTALPVLSSKAGGCGSNHRQLTPGPSYHVIAASSKSRPPSTPRRQRIADIASQVALLPLSLPLILTCTCINQPGLMHELFAVIANRSRAGSNVIQLAQARSGPSGVSVPRHPAVPRSARRDDQSR